MTVKQIYQSIQLDGKQRIEKKAQNLLAVIEQFYGPISFPSNMDSINKIYALLSSGVGCEIIDFLLENGYSLEVELQYLIANIGYFARNNCEQNQFSTFLKFPVLNRIEELEEGYLLDSKVGRIQVFPLTRFSKNRAIIQFALQYNCYGFCHDATHIFLKQNPDYVGVTSLITNQFQEKQYHSYIRGEGGIIDFAHNMYFKEEDFEKVFHPQELNQVAGYALEEAESQLGNDDLGKDKCLLLRLALKEQVR